MRAGRFTPMALVLILGIAGCGPRSAPTDGERADTVDNGGGHCLGAQIVALATTPLASGTVVDLSDAPLDASGRACVESLFEGQTLKTPLAFDSNYRDAFAFHQEGGQLKLASLLPEKMQLRRLAGRGAQGVWWLRAESETAMEGARYDILFATADDGALVDQIVVGAEGMMYQRDFDLNDPMHFRLREDTGREQNTGPRYRGEFAFDEGGHIKVVTSREEPPAGDAQKTSDAATPQAPGTIDANDGAIGTSIESASGAPGDLAAVRDLLFDSDAVLEELVETHQIGKRSVVLAVGRADVASFVLYVLSPTAQQPASGRTQYTVASLVFPEPDQVLGGEVTAHDFTAQSDGSGARIALRVRYDVLQPGGNPDTGEPATVGQDASLIADYALSSGKLVEVDAIATP